MGCELAQVVLSCFFVIFSLYFTGLSKYNYPIYMFNILTRVDTTCHNLIFLKDIV
jgi:hypothetical protein